MKSQKELTDSFTNDRVQAAKTADEATKLREVLTTKADLSKLDIDIQKGMLYLFIITGFLAFFARGGPNWIASRLSLGKGYRPI